MNYSISEMVKISGVGIRTLHYYDEIGLLKPSGVIPKTGHRYYEENSLMQLQQILFYRELKFPLKEIKTIMNAPVYNKEKILLKQRELLKLEQEKIDKLIDLLDAKLEGDTTISFKEFDTKEIESARENVLLSCGEMDNLN